MLITGSSLSKQISTLLSHTGAHDGSFTPHFLRSLGELWGSIIISGSTVSTLISGFSLIEEEDGAVSEATDEVGAVSDDAGAAAEELLSGPATEDKASMAELL